MHIFLSVRHVLRVCQEYAAYYNGGRPSQALHAIPDPYPELRGPPPAKGKLVALPVLGGVQHDYRLAGRTASHTGSLTMPAAGRSTRGIDATSDVPVRLLPEPLTPTRATSPPPLKPCLQPRVWIVGLRAPI